MSPPSRREPAVPKDAVGRCHAPSHPDQQGGRFLAKVARNKTNIVAVALAQALVACGLALGSRILTESASPSALGEYRLVLGIVGIPIALVARPLIQYAMRGYHDAAVAGQAPQFRAYMQRLVARSAALGIPATFVAVSVYLSLHGDVSPLAGAAAGALVLLHSLLSLKQGLLVTESRHIASGVLRVSMQLGTPLVAAVAVLAAGQSGSSLLAGEVVFLASLCILLRATWAPLAPEVPRDAAQERRWARDAWRFAWPLAGVGLFSWVLSLSDRFVLAAFWSPKEVGLYSAVYALGSQPILMVAGAAAQLVYPAVFDAAARKVRATQSRYLLLLAAISAGSGLACVAFLWVFGDPVVDLLLAAEYREGAKPVLLWVAGAYALLGLATSIEVKSHAEKATLAMGVSYGLAAGANLLLSLRWIPGEGPLGAAKATFCGYGLYLALLSYQLIRPGIGASQSRSAHHGRP